MGNHTSKSDYPFQDKPSTTVQFESNEVRVPLSLQMLNVDEILARVDYQTVDNIVNELTLFCSFNSEEKLKYLASKLINGAAENSQLSWKFVQIAQQMSDLSVEVQNDFHITTRFFKDIFIELSIEKTDLFCASGSEQPKHIQEGTATFIGQLFVHDMISSYLIYYWLQQCCNNPDAFQLILSVISSKVTLEKSTGYCDEKIDDLFAMINPPNPTQEIDYQYDRYRDDCDETESDEVASTTDDLQTNLYQLQASGSETSQVAKKRKPRQRGRSRASNSQKTITNNNTKSIQPPPRNLEAKNYQNSFNMKQSFTDMLIDINKTRPTSFDLNRFKSSTDSERKACAVIMLELAVSIPENAALYAAIVRTIVCSHSQSSQNQQTFANHLTELCSTYLDVLFERPISQHWHNKKAVGVFIAELYKRESIKKEVLIKWLNYVEIMVEKNDPASIQTLLCILEITFDTMKKKDVATYQIYIKLIRKINNLKRVPSKFTMWSKQVLKNSTPTNMSKAFSNSSMNSVGFSKAVAAEKITQKIIQPSATTEICSSFQKFLDALQLGKPASHDYLNFHLYQDSALKGCALILVEHASLYPNNAKLYAALTANTLVGQMSNEKKKIFIGFLTHFFETEIVKCFKPSSPEKSNWARIINVGSFLSELYNFEVVEVEIMSKWIGPIYQAGLLGKESSLDALLNVQKTTALKMKARDIVFYNLIIQYAEQLLSSGKLSEKYTALIKEVLSLTKTTNSTASKIYYFGDMQNIVNKMNFGNNSMILNEILALNIPESEENSRKIANIIISKTKQRFDLIPASSEILKQLPIKSSPPMNQDAFSKQVKLSLMSQYNYICNGTMPPNDQTLQFNEFTFQLYAINVLSFEVVKEMLEWLAKLASENKTLVSLVMLLSMIKVFRCQLLQKGIVLPITEATLKKHQRIDNSLIRDSVEGALKILSLDTSVPIDFEVVKISQIAHTSDKKSSLPSTAATSQAKESVKTSINVFNDIDALKRELKQLDFQNADVMNELSLCFFKASRNAKDFVSYTRIAQLIESDISSRIVDCPISFKESLCKHVQAPHGFDRMDNQVIKDTAKNNVDFAAELYKMGLLDVEKLERIIDSLAINDFETVHQVEMFHGLMRIVSLSVIKNSDGEMFRKYRDVLQTKLGLFGGKIYLLSLDIIDTINDILSFEKNVPMKTKEKAFELILSQANNSNIKKVSTRIRSVPLKNISELDELINSLTTKALKSPDEASVGAKLMAEIKGISVESTDGKVTTAREALIEKCQETLLNNLSGEIKLQQMNELKCLLQFISELFIRDVFSSDFINLCFDLLSEDESDNAADCISMLIINTGAHVKAEILEPYFKKFEAIIEKEVSYRSSVFKSLIELQKKNWNQKENENSQNSLSIEASNSEEFNFTMKKLETITNMSIEAVNKSDEKRNEFAQLIMKCMLMRPGKEAVYAELCNQMRLKSQQDRSFTDVILDYFRSRIFTFNSLKKEEFTETVRSRLAIVMIFIGELYQRDFMSDEDFEVLIKPAKHLSFDSLSKLVSIIASKINEGNNVRLMALLITFEDISHERVMDFWKELKDDIVEINDIVCGLHLDTSSEIEA